MPLQNLTSLFSLLTVNQDAGGQRFCLIDFTSQGLIIIIERAGLLAGVYLLTICAEDKQKTL